MNSRNNNRKTSQNIRRSVNTPNRYQRPVPVKRKVSGQKTKLTGVFVLVAVLLVIITVIVHFQTNQRKNDKAQTPGTSGIETNNPTTQLSAVTNETNKTKETEESLPRLFFEIEAGESIPEEAVFLEGTKDGTILLTDISTIPFATPGEYELEYSFDDIIFGADLKVVDTTPPVISGAEDIAVETGDTVSYRRNVEVSDNSDQPVELNIDSSQVDIRQPGTYEVKYIAQDSSGNIAEAVIKVIVAEKTANEPDSEEVNRLADNILAEITQPEMSPREKAEAIYWWTKQHIVYVNHSDKSSWITGAYQGFTKGTGDCFNYFATAKALLERAGIDNIDVVKSTGSHFWSMINIGSGWYHFDTTPRKAGGEFFMLTDAALTEYSNNHNDSHVWDRDKYPATPDA